MKISHLCLNGNGAKQVKLVQNHITAIFRFRKNIFEQWIKMPDTEMVAYGLTLDRALKALVALRIREPRHDGTDPGGTLETASLFPLHFVLDIRYQ
ncbi:MAG: hypothetical protein ACLP3B_28375 [Syntrophobacteraceae bacterium]